jgi:hypothetical protein
MRAHEMGGSHLRWWLLAITTIVLSPAFARLELS